MAIFHHPLLVMSLSGSLVMALYGLTCPLARRWLPHWWRKRVLLLALFFYLAPVPLLKDRLRDQINNWTWKHLPAIKESSLNREFFDVVDPGYAINVQTNTLGPEVIFTRAVVLLLAVMAATVIIGQLWRYIGVYRSCLSGAFCAQAPPPLQREFERVKDELKMRRPVRLVCSRFCDTPLTIGVFAPTVIFPSAGRLELGADDRVCILKHELFHIKSGDLPIKFLTLFAVALHWYDPVCWIMYHELCVVSELDCDYGVTREFSDAQRRRYGSLILDLATAGGGKRERFSMGLASDSAAAFQRRLSELRPTPKRGKPVLAGFLAAAFCALGTMTAFAYQSPLFFESPDDWRQYELIFYESTPHDSFRIGPDGEVIPYDFGPDQAACHHQFHGGAYTRHQTNDSGGCVMKEYQLFGCALCGYEQQGELIGQTAYDLCPHDDHWNIK